MKFKPHQEQKKKEKNHRAVFLWVTFNFIKIVRKRACIAMPCGSNAKFSFSFTLILRLLVFHLFMFT